MGFEEFGFAAELNEGLLAMGFETPTPIQQKSIPVILENKDLIACAQTGTGKTAAYLLPIIHKIITSGHGSFNTLIIVPTRELAVQIDESIQAFTYFTSVSTIAVFGGNDGILFEQEKRAFKEGADMIVATPGRLISHIAQGYVNFSSLKHLILDEADRMLDMGFNDDIQRIISLLPSVRNTLLFSATMPGKIRTLAKKILKNPVEINIALSKPAEGVLQAAYVLYEEQKLKLLSSLLTGKEITSVLIFSSTKEKVKRLGIELLRSKFQASAIHSDLEQKQRNEILRNFSNKSLSILVATDILSRGIDIDSIGLVINYDVPGDAEDYIHRVGRTARAESTGVAITFINPEDQSKFQKIENLIGEEIKKIPLPAEFGPAPEYHPEKHKKHFSKRRNKR